jgi:hypothetical protein
VRVVLRAGEDEPDVPALAVVQPAACWTTTPMPPESCRSLTTKATFTRARGRRAARRRPARRRGGRARLELGDAGGQEGVVGLQAPALGALGGEIGRIDRGHRRQVAGPRPEGQDRGGGDGPGGHGGLQPTERALLARLDEGGARKRDDAQEPVIGRQQRPQLLHRSLAPSAAHARVRRVRNGEHHRRPRLRRAAQRVEQGREVVEEVENAEGADRRAGRRLPHLLGERRRIRALQEDRCGIERAHRALDGQEVGRGRGHGPGQPSRALERGAGRRGPRPRGRGARRRCPARAQRTARWRRPRSWRRPVAGSSSRPRPKPRASAAATASAKAAVAMPLSEAAGSTSSAAGTPTGAVAGSEVP